MTKLTLYAQPLDAAPVVSKRALKKGELKEGGSLGGLALTDIGKAVWDGLDKIFAEFEIDIIESGVAPSPWSLMFTTSQFRLVLSRRGYRALEGAMGSYITLDFDGDKHSVYKFLKTFLKMLRRAPWEMAFPGDFRHKTHTKMSEVKEDWQKFAEGISLEKEEPAEEAKPILEKMLEGKGDLTAKDYSKALGRLVENARKEAAEAKLAAEPEPAPEPAPTYSLSVGSFLSFDGEELMFNVRVENGSSVSLEKVLVTAKASPEGIGFEAPVKQISYLKAGEELTLAFPLKVQMDAAAGEVWADVEGSAGERKLAAATQKRPLKAALPALEPVGLGLDAWHRKMGTLVKRDEVRSKVYMAASEAFDEMLMRLKEGAGLFLLDPEVIHTGSNYLGHLKMYAEGQGKSPFGMALDCIGDYKESKITLHFYAESAELVMALREKILAVLAGKG